MSNGVIYIADGRKWNGKEDCVQEASRSAVSVKEHSPDVRTLIWTDAFTSSPCFDEVRSLTELNAKFHGGRWLPFARKTRKNSRHCVTVWCVMCGMKLMAMVDSPFENTLYLDTETRILNPIDDVFEIDCDFGIAFEYPKTTVMNAGVVLLRGPDAKDFAMRWYNLWNGLNASDHDQAVLPLAMRRHGESLRYSFLDWQIWNVRPYNVKHNSIPKERRYLTKILHDRFHTPEQFFDGV